MVRKLFLHLLVICILGNPVCIRAQISPVVGYDFSFTDRKIKGWIDSNYYNGAGLIVVRNDTVIFKKQYGSYDEHTVAHIASAGKWLAAAAIAAVVEEGKIKWDDKVSKWLPEFKDSKGDATLCQLFSHTSGYPDYQPSGHHRDDYQTLKESVEHILALPPDTPPGAVFHYGGLGMQVAGRMVEIAAAKDWETICQEKIASPLGMTDTHFTPVDSTEGHNPMLGGGARTTLHDYAAFLSMIYNKGMYKDRRVLSAASVAYLERDHVGNADRSHTRSGYCSGCQRGEDDSAGYLYLRFKNQAGRSL